MDGATEKAVTRVIELLGGVRTFRCNYQDLSVPSETHADRLVEIKGNRDGVLHLRTVNGAPEVETLITRDRLVRVDYTSRNGYRIDFSRYPFTDFHRYGWLRLDHPFALIDSETLRFRTEIGETASSLLFEANLSPSYFGEWSPSKTPPTAQIRLDSKSGLLRELLVLSNDTAQRFIFTSYAVNRRFDKHEFSLDPKWAVGDITDFYWSQICVAHEGTDPSAPFFSLN